MKKSAYFKCMAVGACALALTITSCVKGDRGPAGPQGQSGSSNVQSFPITTVNSNWNYNATENSYDLQISVPAITQSVVDGGTIQVFLGNGSGNDWAAMPFAYGLVQYNFDYSLGLVNVYVTLSSGQTPTNPGGQQFKIVVIPPAQKSANPDPTVNNAPVELIVNVK